MTPRANASTQAKLLHTACGFNLGDRGVGEEAEHVIEEFDVHGLGVLYLQSDDINNMTVKGGNWTFAEPAVSALLGVASKASPHPLPFLFVSDACSSTSKPYRCVRHPKLLAHFHNLRSPPFLSTCRRPATLPLPAGHSPIFR
mgnify:CR=1 FL=1